MDEKTGRRRLAERNYGQQPDRRWAVFSNWRGRKEKKIRTDPAARANDLHKTVFVSR